MQPPRALLSRGILVPKSISTTHPSHQLRRRAMNSLAAASDTSLKKLCATCGRQITWRKKWEKNWELIKYCSDSCRKHKIKPDSLDTAFESRILALLSERQKCQGAAARVTCEEAEAEVLSELKISQAMQVHEEKDSALSENSFTRNRPAPSPSRTRERCRQAARRLAARGAILVIQEGKVVDPSFAKGVMELTLPS